MDSLEENDLTHSQRMRLIFIEKQLMWGRSFKARMMMERLGVSRQQVGLDFSLYMKLCPDNVEPYNPAKKAYTPTTGFTPMFFSGEGFAEVENSVVHQVPVVRRSSKANVLAVILAAIQEFRSIEFVYGSASTPIGKKRAAVPTRLISTANRLHFRAYCFENKDYRDFSISRCLTVPKIKPRSKIDIPIDIDWGVDVEITLKANPALDKDGRELVYKEYGAAMDEIITIPGPTLNYFLIDNNYPSTKSELALANKQPWVYPILASYSERFSRFLFA